jgi:3-hydroxybutyryl-CoA dehydrogenase
VPPLRPGGLVELTRSRRSSEAAVAAAERFVATLGMHVAWVGDAPGLVLARIVASLVNEAAFAIAEGVAAAGDVDEGMVLGLNHPRGPLAWAEAMGVEHVVRVIDGLAEGTGTDRYGLAPLLGRMLHDGAHLGE